AAPTWNSKAVYLFDTQGHVKPGWPFVTGTEMWSPIAIGDLGNDGHKELVMGSHGPNLYALRSNGTEWIDGDANPATLGVFKNVGGEYNFGCPAIVDLDRNGTNDIVYASASGVLYAWRPDGSNLPGFPVTLNQMITSSVAVGYLDGSGDTVPEIVVEGSGDSLFVIEGNGARRPGFPIYV